MAKFWARDNKYFVTGPGGEVELVDSDKLSTYINLGYRPANEVEVQRLLITEDMGVAGAAARGFLGKSITADRDKSTTLQFSDPRDPTKIISVQSGPRRLLDIANKEQFAEGERAHPIASAAGEIASWASPSGKYISKLGPAAKVLFWRGGLAEGAGRALGAGASAVASKIAARRGAAKVAALEEKYASEVAAESIARASAEKTLAADAAARMAVEREAAWDTVRNELGGGTVTEDLLAKEIARRAQDARRLEEVIEASPGLKWLKPDPDDAIEVAKRTLSELYPASMHTELALREALTYTPGWKARAASWLATEAGTGATMGAISVAEDPDSTAGDIIKGALYGAVVGPLISGTLWGVGAALSAPSTFAKWRLSKADEATEKVFWVPSHAGGQVPFDFTKRGSFAQFKKDVEAGVREYKFHEGVSRSIEGETYGITGQAGKYRTKADLTEYDQFYLWVKENELTAKLAKETSPRARRRMEMELRGVREGTTKPGAIMSLASSLISFIPMASGRMAGVAAGGQDIGRLFRKQIETGGFLSPERMEKFAKTVSVASGFTGSIFKSRQARALGQHILRKWATEDFRDLKDDLYLTGPEDIDKALDTSMPTISPEVRQRVHEIHGALSNELKAVLPDNDSPVTELQKIRVARILATAANPVEAANALMAGATAPDVARVLKAISPERFQVMQESTRLAQSDSRTQGKVLSQASKRTGRILDDQPAWPPQLVQRLQSSYQQKEKPSGAKSVRPEMARTPAQSFGLQRKA